MRPIVIGLCGPAGSGKSSVATYLVEKYGAVRFSFARPLKEMVRLAFDLSDEQVYGTQEQKEAIDPRYNVSARWLLQRIGTEGCRAVFGEQFWTQQAIASILRVKPRLAVIEDMRFVDEGRAIHDGRDGGDSRYLGFNFRLWPPGDDVALARAIAAGAHASEQDWKKIDAAVEITPVARGLDEICTLVDKALKMLGITDCLANPSYPQGVLL